MRRVGKETSMIDCCCCASATVNVTVRVITCYFALLYTLHRNLNM